MDVAELSLRALEERVARLDAKVKVSPGQLGLDFSAPPPPKPKPTAAAGKGPGGGEQCGGSWIDPKETCHKGQGGGTTGTAPEAGGYKKTPQVNAGLQAKPMSIATGGDKTYDVAQEREKHKGGLRFWRSTNGRPGYHYWFRDKDVAAHWLAEDDAKSDADAEVGSDKRRSKEWQAEFKASYEAHRNMLRDVSDYDMLQFTEDRAFIGKATRGGTVVDVRIAGNKHSRPIREGFFDGRGKKEAEAPPEADDEPVLTNPDRYDPGLAPTAKEAGISALDVTTSAQQAQLARQQYRAAQEAGDQKGAEAWREQERKAERDRLQAAIGRSQQKQSSLFGATEYDETMPLFRQRRDSVDPVAQLCSSILREQLPGAQVLDWNRHPRGITAGRAVSEGLVYRFRLDAASIGYQPAWDGIDERQWELRSEGFLAARDPSVRLDYKRSLKFQQKTTKRQCSKGYGCGSACISLNKECRVQPKSAISKVRLRQLQALAQEGDQKAATQAQELQMQREAKAQSLQKGRQVGRLEKMLQDPRVAEMVRTGKVPEAAAEGAKPGQVRDIKPSEVEVDPERFQYKIGSSASGEVGSLSGVQRWDPNLAGVISVWQDPEDGKTYVVNGHNRLALAKRLGAEEVTVRYLKAGSAQEARAIGAMQNIAEGAGTEIDAGKFFRDSGLKTLEDVKALGLPLRSGKAEKGLALAQLPDEMFNDVIQGNLRMNRAAVIGGSGLDQDKQREVYKVLKARPSMTDETLREYVEHLAVSSRQTQEEIDLFGTEEKSVDTGLARAELANGLKKSLGREARLLGAVSKSAQAVELLEQKGGNTINVEQSQQQADEASSVLRFFDQLKSVSGPVAVALDQAAARVTAGENRNKVARELRQEVIQAMEEELRQLGLKKDEPPKDELTMNLFDADDRFDALADRLAVLQNRMDRRCQRPDGTFYGTSGRCKSGKEVGKARALVQAGANGPAVSVKKAPPAVTAKASGPSTAPTRSELSGEIAPPAGKSAAPSRSRSSVKQFASDPGPKGEQARKKLANFLDGYHPLLKEHYKKFAAENNLTDVEAGAILHYSKNGYIAMNILMRGKNPPPQAYAGLGGKAQGPARAVEAIVALESAMQKLPLYKGPLTRGIRVARDQVDKFFRVGEEYADPAFQSASAGNAKSNTNYGTVFGHRAIEYSQATTTRGPGNNAINTVGVTLKISGDHGGRYIGRGSSAQQEEEVLIPRGQRFRVKKITKQLNHMTVELEAISESNQKAAATPRRRKTRKDSADRFDSLLARIDALKRKCQTGYACGSSCISADKDCRSEGRATTGKERLKRLEQAAQGGATGRGIGRLTGGAAAAKVEEIKASRSEQAAQLRGQRAQRRSAGGALVTTGGSVQAVTPEVVTPEVVQPGSSSGRPGSIASTMRETLNAMKAADARQMGMIAEQLFETDWLLERRGRYRGMSKDQAREQYKVEFMQKLQEQASSPEAAARREAMARRAAESGSVSGAMRSLLEDMKASDERLNDLTRQAIDLRVGAEEQFGGEGDEPTLGGSSNRRRLGRGRRRDAVDDRFDAAIERLQALSIRMDQRCKRPDGSYYGTSGECRKGKLAGAARNLGQRIKGLGRRLLGRGAKVSEADAMAAAERIQQMAAARQREERERQAKEKAREEELLSRGPQEWGVKQVEKNEVRGRGDKGVVWHESRYEVQLEEPLRLPVRPGKEPRLVDKLSFQVAVEEANAKPIARKLGEQGINLSHGQVNNALELAWLTGAGGGEAFMGADRMELPTNVARRFAMEVSKQVKGLVSNMEEGQIVLCKAHEDDGYGDKRRSLYERAGFTFIDGTGIAVVRNGRLSRIEGARGDRLDAGDAIDLDDLILALLTFGGDAR